MCSLQGLSVSCFRVLGRGQLVSIGYIMHNYKSAPERMTTHRFVDSRNAVRRLLSSD